MDEHTKEIVAGVVYDLLGYLTSMDHSITVGGAHSVVPLVTALQAWEKSRNFHYDDVRVPDWNKEIPRARNQMERRQAAKHGE